MITNRDTVVGINLPMYSMVKSMAFRTLAKQGAYMNKHMNTLEQEMEELYQQALKRDVEKVLVTLMRNPIKSVTTLSRWIAADMAPLCLTVNLNQE